MAFWYNEIYLSPLTYFGVYFIFYNRHRLTDLVLFIIIINPLLSSILMLRLSLGWSLGTPSDKFLWFCHVLVILDLPTTRFSKLLLNFVWALESAISPRSLGSFSSFRNQDVGIGFVHCYWIVNSSRPFQQAEVGSM